MNIDKVIKANDLIEEIKSAILGNTIITIRDDDTNEFLWSCHTGESYGKFKNMRLKIDQDINLHAVLKAINIALNDNKGLTRCSNDVKILKIIKEN